MLSEKALEDFKKILQEEYKEEISNERAVELAINLLTFFDNVYRPVRKEWLDEAIKKENENKNIKYPIREEKIY
ncbi:MAG: hypothetical protein A2312_00385 [Candidatus Staskawiczbacteria bacterium RIFOXYB2_FULL_32_9]|uniref:Uncharacterized protein n=1 Tax=Candidatus Staskawiczbacteria bacterium RIFOXYD1_FULL_32_13 TaxID=1802234 RepID=A0A1G2JKN0_9BACT|nr:MAG: hypothetical protein UR22_C0001G0062 [Parcubacteria group bacterium GW2011_GWC2_32_10]OGZ77564.1 MAG: hypothetical protein A2256_02275 [Candidatus Staskawiczbacteria bacterium RIFOXYA2_FULL_32_7]OGZ78266.1 MAG: hypothetical protein A2360_03805 [Candidatus Staskawiczbacteria bacterium RIFOXYB1_FULL_32_11]OGZ84551.1 MAG: hypothetical protein A2312_00385 [Candidatus Staskawiczbacteria bacterium RIFOXYB2_FULL_32_9]OGZ87245.1 MAG: hypothetical protein A2463_02690 [Candidatus Staskawiczbacter